MADEMPAAVGTKEVELTAEEVAANDDRRRPKRGRDSTFGPTTPKGEGDETKSLAGLTPLAKKGRVQTDTAASGLSTEQGADSDTESAPAEEAADREAAGTPPLKQAAGSAPDTPDQPTTPKVPETEGKETKHIRQRVEALEWEDGKQGEKGEAKVAQPAAGTTEDTDIEDSSQVEPKAAPATAAVAEVTEAASSKDGETKAEGGKAAGTTEDVKIPEAAEEAVLAPEVMAVGPVKSATTSEKGDKEEVTEVKGDVADGKAPVASTSASAAEPKPAPAISKSFGSFTASASPFSSFSTAASPFGKVPAPAPPPPASDQKPKVKSNISFGTFSADPSTSAATIGSAEPSASTSTSTSTASPSTSAPAPATAQPPKTTLPSGFSSSSASPFGAFASTSGFASATSKAKPSTSGSNGFGAFSGAAFATFGSAASTPKDEKADDGAKAEAVPEPEEAKRVFTEQEVITGEEDEEVLHSVRSKLYAMVDGGWVERGAGLFKLNGVPNSGSHAARLVMRADATHRLLLNAPLFSKFAIDVFQEKYVRFVVIEAAGPISYMLRTANANAASAVVEAIRDRVGLLAGP